MKYFELKRGDVVTLTNGTKVVFKKMDGMYGKWTLDSQPATFGLNGDIEPTGVAGQYLQTNV